MADNPYGIPPPSGDPRNPGGPGGPGGLSGDFPPRPVWETAVLALCGLSLGLFFFPDSLVPPNLKLGVGLTATALLIWVFSRRIRAMRGSLVRQEEQFRTGGPKPYHIGRRHGQHKQ